MTSSLVGLTVLALSLMLRKLLDLEFSKQPVLLFLAMAGFLTAIGLEGIALATGEREVVVFIYIAAVFGWLLLVISLFSASGALFRDGEAPVDVAVNEYMIQHEEKIREEVQRKMAERNSEP